MRASARALPKSTTRRDGVRLHAEVPTSPRAAAAQHGGARPSAIFTSPPQPNPAVSSGVDTVQDAEELFGESLRALRGYMKRAVAVPSSARWRLDASAGPTVVAEVRPEDLERNLQDDAAAAPFFALCLAWWFERAGLFAGRSVRARVEVVDGEVPDTPHGRRSAFVLHELARLVPERFESVPSVQVRWPARPTLNAAIADRDAVARPERGGEHAIEVAFTQQKELAAEFAPIGAIDGFRRQLPVGLFDGAVSAATRWGPGAKSQIDLWTPSRDGRTVHLFELKDGGNCKVGILPEALWYARLLHAVRTGNLGGRAVAGGGDAMDAVRRADRIAMWLLVQDVHPLVRVGEDSPLAWLRDAMKPDGVTLGVLPYEWDGARVRLRPDLRWE